MDESRLVGPELYFTGFDFLHRSSDVKGNGASLGIRHQPLGTENLAQPSYGLHDVRSRDQSIEVSPVFFSDLLHHIFATHEISACCFGFLHLFAAGDNQDLLRLAQTVRKHHGPANHLVSVLGIDSQTHCDLDSLVELGVFNFLQQRHRILQRIRTFLHRLARLRDVLSCFSHLSFLVCHRGPFFRAAVVFATLSSTQLHQSPWSVLFPAHSLLQRRQKQHSSPASSVERSPRLV